MPHDAQGLWKLDLDLWNSGKAELVPQVYTAQATHAEPGHEAVHGPAEIGHWMSVLHTAFPDFKVEFTRTVTEGNQFVLCWTCHGTHKGEFLGIAPTGKHVDLQGVTVGRTSHGHIHEERLYYDRLGFLEQVGAVPALAHIQPESVMR